MRLLGDLGKFWLAHTCVPAQHPVPELLALHETSEGYLQITADLTPEAGPAILEITAPPEFAGSYMLDATVAAQLQSGPVALAAPALGSSGGQPGATLTLERGALWALMDAPMPPSSNRQLSLDGQVLPGATLPYPSTMPGGYRLKDSLTDGLGTADAVSNRVALITPDSRLDSFTAPNNTDLETYIGESGVAWENFHTDAAPRISNGRARASGSNSFWKRADVPAQNQRVSALLTYGPDVQDTAFAVACRCGENKGSYWFRYQTGNSSWQLYKTLTGGSAVLLAQTVDSTGFVPGHSRMLTLEAIGQSLTCLVDGVAVLSATDSTHSTGSGGLVNYKARPAGLGYEFDSFIFEDLD